LTLSNINEGLINWIRERLVANSVLIVFYAADFRLHLQVHRTMLRQDLIRTFRSTVIRWSSIRNYTWKQQLTLAHHVLATAPKQFRHGGSLDVRFNAHGPVNKWRLFPTNSITSRSRDYGRRGGWIC